MMDARAAFNKWIESSHFRADDIPWLWPIWLAAWESCLEHTSGD